MRRDVTDYYKLTDQSRRTHGGFPWPEPGEWVKAEPGELIPCTPTALHGYTSPLLAVLLNPIHGSYAAGLLLWKAEYDGEVRCDGLKVFGKRQRICGEPLPLPVFTARQLVVFAILVTRLVLERGVIPVWDDWADLFLTGDAEAARAAAWKAAARAAAWKAAARAAAWKAAAWAAEAEAAWEAAWKAAAWEAAAEAAWEATAEAARAAAGWAAARAAASAAAGWAAEAAGAAARAAASAAAENDKKWDGFTFAAKLHKCAEKALEEAR